MLRAAEIGAAALSHFDEDQRAIARHAERRVRVGAVLQARCLRRRLRPRAGGHAGAAQLRRPLRAGLRSGLCCCRQGRRRCPGALPAGRRGRRAERRRTVPGRPHPPTRHADGAACNVLPARRCPNSTIPSSSGCNSVVSTRRIRSSRPTKTSVPPTELPTTNGFCCTSFTDTQPPSEPERPPRGTPRDAGPGSEIAAPPPATHDLPAEAWLAIA